MNLKFWLIVAILTTSFQFCESGDWVQWRGPLHNGHAAEGEKPPLTWSETENVLWKTPIPGRGHSSPTILGDYIFLTTADEDSEKQMVIAFDRQSGRQRWNSTVLEGNFPEKIHKKNTHATPTVATDGEQVYAVFFNGVSVYLVALDMAGKLRWIVKTGEFHSRYPFGFAASPILYKETVLVTSEYEEGGYMAAFRKKDGAEVWRTHRSAGTSYSSPIVANLEGKDQLLISGQRKISSFNPANGDLMWETAGSSPATCGTMVWSENAVYASGGFPNKETIAVKADGSGDVLWRNGEKCYEQSMLHVDGYIYAINDGGIAFCWDAVTGEEKWKVRLRGPVSASPIFVDGKIYATNEQGITYVYQAEPDEYRELARNHLGQSGFATSAFVDNKIYIRTAVFQGNHREEFLYCIGK